MWIQLINSVRQKNNLHKFQKLFIGTVLETLH